MENGEAPKTIEEKKLTGRLKKFADLYLGEFNLNGTRAAIAAGYSEKSAPQIASQNLRKLNVRKYIDEQLNTNVLTASEVLSILSTQAKGTISDVLNEEGRFDLEHAKKQGTDRLIKEIDITEELDSDGNPVSRKYRLKIHDSQSAAEKVGRFHKLFTDKREVSGSISTYSMTKEEWEREAAQKLSQVADQLGKFDEQQSDNIEDTDSDS